MHMYKTVGQEMKNQADNDTRNWMLNKAKTEAKADAAIIFSSRLDSLIRHVIAEELNRVEIIELLSQESIQLHNTGLKDRGVIYCRI